MFRVKVNRFRCTSGQARGPRLRMSSAKQSYATIISSGTQSPRSTAPKMDSAQVHSVTSGEALRSARAYSNKNLPRGRSSSPAFEPDTEQSEATYVLTFMTDRKQHKILTDMRDKYFPRKLNKLQAHLTLFHALPGSKLDEVIIPTLEDTARSNKPFHVIVTTPFKIKKGIAIGVPKTAGGDKGRQIHQQLRSKWEEFLSDQDAHGGFAAHYTIMNKVDDEKEVDEAFREVEKNFRAVHGSIEGFELFKYVKGHWEFVRNFHFNGGSGENNDHSNK